MTRLTHLFCLVGAIICVAAGHALATELGVKETRGWSYCLKEGDAVEIGNLYFDAGYEIASSAWEKYMKLGLCKYETMAATPLNVMWNRADWADTVSVVALRLEDDSLVSWFRLEPNR